MVRHNLTLQPAVCGSEVWSYASFYFACKVTNYIQKNNHTEAILLTFLDYLTSFNVLWSLQ